MKDKGLNSNLDIKKYLSDLKIQGESRRIPNISANTAQFILNLLKKDKISSMLEVGCANGYSSMHWAYHLKQNNGKLHIIDNSAPMLFEAYQNIVKYKLHTNVVAHLGEAMEILPKLALKSFDCIFIDAQKKYYKQFLQLSMPLLKEKGLIIIDDVIKFRHKMLDLFEYLEEINALYNIEKTDSDDGILWMHKI